jgi:pimeloyl-ACP methyl ester carboxylesterase
MGCRVILQGYLDAPQRVAGLILVDGSCLAKGDPKIVEQTVYQKLQSVGYTTTIRRLFGDMFLEENDPALKERILSRALAFPEKLGAALLPRISGWDARTLESALSQIAVPLLVLQSTYINTETVRVPLKPGVTTPWLELIQHHVPTAWIEIVKGVGHFSMLEAPEAVNHIIAGFVAKIAH